MSDYEKIRLIIKNILKEQFDAIKEETTEAPVKTPTEIPAKPNRRTIKKPKIHPGSQPKPKAQFSSENMMEQYTKDARRIDESIRMRQLISEAPMDIDSTHGETPDPSLKAGIEGSAETPFSSVELFRKGELDLNTLEKLGSEEFNDVVREVLRTGKLSMMEIQQTLIMIMRIESSHTRELESLALNTVKKMFGLPDELSDNIEASLKGMDEGSITPPDDSDSGGDEEDYSIDDFTDEELLSYALLAHKMDITLNDLFILAIEDGIKYERERLESFTS